MAHFNHPLLLEVEAWKDKPFTNKPWGNKPIPQKTKDAIIKYIVDEKHSSYSAMKKWKKHQGSIFMILRKAGYKFKGRNPKNVKDSLGGKWVKI